MSRSRRAVVSPHDLADFADLVRVALGSGFTVLRALALVCALSSTGVASAFAMVLVPADDSSPLDALAALPENAFSQLPRCLAQPPSLRGVLASGP